MVAANLIELDRVSKRFGGVTALDEVSFGIRQGEIHAIVGENGAGKSTLMKLLAGVHAPDGGDIRLDGRVVRFSSPRDAQRAGISIVFQELNLFPHRSVAANIFANREQSGPLGLLDRRAMVRASEQILRDMNVDLDANAPVELLSIGQRQQVEIARALNVRSRIVILDEPNSALTDAESERLFQMVRQLRGGGMTILYVSHRLEEVFRIADRITIVRDGRWQATRVTSETTVPQVIAAMVGRPLAQVFPPRQSSSASAPVTLRVDNLCAGPRLGPISLEARAGEILGFAGLEGAGIEELFDVLFGLKKASGGSIVDSRGPAVFAAAADAIRRGWALIPKSRRDQGLMMDWSIARNSTLLVLQRLCNRLGLVKNGAMRTEAQQWIRQLGIGARGGQSSGSAAGASGGAPRAFIDQRVVHLSGGNQQKVLLAKWLATRPRVLLLNDPTRGVDVGAKQEIYAWCQLLASEGLTVLFTSSEADEILGLADRTIVLCNGRIVRQFQRNEATKAQLVYAMTGASKIKDDPDE